MMGSCFAPGVCSLINALISLVFAIYYCVGCVYWNCIRDYLFPVHYIHVLLYKRYTTAASIWTYIPDSHCEVSRHFEVLPRLLLYFQNVLHQCFRCIPWTFPVSLYKDQMSNLHKCL